MHFSLPSSIAAALLLATSASTHGIISNPYPRVIGNASLSTCGSAITALIKADNTSHVEGLPEAGATDPAYNSTECNLFLCKGLKFADVPVTGIQSYMPGQVVNITVYIRIPHEGTANFSIVDTKMNQVVGEPLIYFDRYADNALAVLPASNTNFAVTIPGDLGGKCKVAGDCVSSSLCKISQWKDLLTIDLGPAIVLVWDSGAADVRIVC